MYAYIDEACDHVWDVYEYNESYDYLIDNWHPQEIRRRSGILSWMILEKKDDCTLEQFYKSVSDFIDDLNMENVRAGLIDPYNCGLTLEALIKYFGKDRFMCNYDCSNCGNFNSSVYDVYDPLEFIDYDEIPF